MKGFQRLLADIRLLVSIFSQITSFTRESIRVINYYTLPIHRLEWYRLVELVKLKGFVVFVNQAKLILLYTKRQIENILHGIDMIKAGLVVNAEIGFLEMR